MHRVFISYHHANDQRFKDHLVWLNGQYNIFIDRSVNTNSIDDNLPSETIRQKIRDEYLRDSTVTILLVGIDTRFRKHVDWELKSSMINGPINKRSGILVIKLPSTSGDAWEASLPEEKKAIYPDYAGSWVTTNYKSEYEARYPEMPPRIIDNLINPNVVISVVPWSRIENSPANLNFLIAETAKTRTTNQYDLNLPMRRKDHNPNAFGM